MKFSKVYTLPYPPVAYKSAKAGKYGYYNPMSLHKSQCVLHLQHQHSGFKVLREVPVKVIAVYYMPLTKRILKMKNKPKYHITTPDGDNMTKFYYDCLQAALIIHNDKIICSHSHEKLYAYNTEPHVELFVEQLDA